MTVTKEYLRDLLSEETVPYELNPEWEVVTNVAVVAAARFVERLLPEKCSRHPDVGIPAVSRAAWACDFCHGSGQLWDEGLVSVVAQALYRFDAYPIAVSATYSGDGVSQLWEQQTDALRNRFREMARAVLAALTQEVGK